jgi:cell division transport system permease protein
MEAVTQLEKNPLMDAFIIRAKSLEDYNRILAVISLSENQELIKFQNFTDHQKIIDRVMIISAKVEQVSLFLTIIFAVISILIVFNSIRLTIYTHREEIAVMKLVGANNWFVRLPFLLEGIIYAIFALVVAMIIIYALFYAIGSYLSEFLEAYNFSLLKYYNQNLLFIIGGEFLAVALLNIISSAVAVGKYLRV